jgi:hypothetical protein
MAKRVPQGRGAPALCPSAQPDIAGAIAIGVVDHGSAVPEVAYLDSPLPVSADLLDAAAPLKPTEIFRFAGQCQQDACSHWNGARCKLAQRIVQGLPAVVDALPQCHVRRDCRWYAQEGSAACYRCPQVVTQNEDPSDAMREAALPR